MYMHSRIGPCMQLVQYLLLTLTKRHYPHLCRSRPWLGSDAPYSVCPLLLVRMVGRFSTSRMHGPMRERCIAVQPCFIPNLSLSPAIATFDACYRSYSDENCAQAAQGPPQHNGRLLFYVQVFKSRLDRPGLPGWVGARYKPAAIILQVARIRYH
jgi:hypothetical protein